MYIQMVEKITPTRIGTQRIKDSGLVNYKTELARIQDNKVISKKLDRYNQSRQQLVSQIDEYTLTDDAYEDFVFGVKDPLKDNLNQLSSDVKNLNRTIKARGYPSIDLNRQTKNELKGFGKNIFNVKGLQTIKLYDKQTQQLITDLEGYDANQITQTGNKFLRVSELVPNFVTQSDIKQQLQTQRDDFIREKQLTTQFLGAYNTFTPSGAIDYRFEQINDFGLSQQDILENSYFSAKKYQALSDNTQKYNQDLTPLGLDLKQIRPNLGVLRFEELPDIRQEVVSYEVWGRTKGNPRARRLQTYSSKESAERGAKNFGYNASVREVLGDVNYGLKTVKVIKKPGEYLGLYDDSGNLISIYGNDSSFVETRIRENGKKKITENTYNPYILNFDKSGNIIEERKKAVFQDYYDQRAGSGARRTSRFKIFDFETFKPGELTRKQSFEAKSDSGQILIGNSYYGYGTKNNQLFNKDVVKLQGKKILKKDTYDNFLTNNEWVAKYDGKSNDTGMSFQSRGIGLSISTDYEKGERTTFSLFNAPRKSNYNDILNIKKAINLGLISKPNQYNQFSQKLQNTFGRYVNVGKLLDNPIYLGIRNPKEKVVVFNTKSNTVFTNTGRQYNKGFWDSTFSNQGFNFFKV